MILYVHSIPRNCKRILIGLMDACIIFVSYVISVALRLEDRWDGTMFEPSAQLGLVLWLGGIALMPIFAIQSIRISTFDLRGAARIALFSLTLVVLGVIANKVMVNGAPRTVPVIFAVVLFALMVGWRDIARFLLTRAHRHECDRVPVAVYGAGSAGTQLIAALAQSVEFHVVAVVDDSPGLRGVYTSGHCVQSPAVLEKLVRSGRIRRIILAMPSTPKRRQREIVADLEALPCEVHAMPGYAELVTSGDLLGSVRSISSDDLLERSAVDLEIPDAARAYSGKSVLISGAGGSIGSELCRQVLSCNPRRIVLLEINEYALYKIDREIRPLAEAAGVEVVSALGSVCNQARVRALLQDNLVEIVLHAAAYKHVPLVEANEVEGVRNNVFGTRIVAELSRELGVERFILISTDKAVRPSNVMGATKRLAEMVVQDLQSRSVATKFAMVRFGNVIGSSGSVIPLFMSQIAAGGPITLTHPEVTRFFMTATEAARLVLLAGAYANGGDLFVLDMGKPVRIRELARRMVQLSGLTLKDAANPEGDIEIRVTGLRRGEKLYEELLIDGVLLPTPHSKILRAEEGCPSQIEVAGLLQELRRAVDTGSAEAVRRQIVCWVEGYGSVPDQRPAPPSRAAPAGPRGSLDLATPPK